MKKTGLAALLLALVMLLAGCAQDEEAVLSRTVIRVGDAGYSYGELLEMEDSLRASYDEMAALYESYGLTMEPVTEDAIRNEALNTLLLQAVVLDKANQMKLSELTDAEKRQLLSQTDAEMASYRAAVEEGMVFDEGATDAEKAAAVEAELAAQGVTRSAVYKIEREAYIVEKTKTWAVSGVTVSEEEFLAAYDAQVASEKTSCGQDPSHYGLTLLNGQTPVYAPAGYRTVEWILLTPSGADEATLAAIENARHEAEHEATHAEEHALEHLGAEADLAALTAQVQVELDEVTDPLHITVKQSGAAFGDDLNEEARAAVIALAEAQALEKAYAEQRALAEAAAHEALQPEIDEILMRLRNRERWDLVREHYSDDAEMQAGVPVVCEGFAYAPAAFVDAAMALEKPGDWSEAVPVEGYGCFIIRYMEDVAEGPVNRDSVREEMIAQLLANKQEETFSATLDMWVANASGKMLINYSLLELDHDHDHDH